MQVLSILEHTVQADLAIYVPVDLVLTVPEAIKQVTLFQYLQW